MLEMALDQIEYMNEMLQLNTLSSRIGKFIELSRQKMYAIEPLPKYSEFLLKELAIFALVVESHNLSPYN